MSNPNITFSRLSFWWQSGCHMFALRMVLYTGVTWLVSMRIAEPNAQLGMLATAGVIGLSQQDGASIQKMFFRILGTVAGGLYLIGIVGPGLADAELHNTFIIIGIVMAVIFGTLIRGPGAYAAAVFGLTVSIVGVKVSLNPTIPAAFDLIESRVGGIIIAIITCEAINFILPSTIESKLAEDLKKKTKQEAEKILQQCFSASSPAPTFSAVSEFTGLMNNAITVLSSRRFALRGGLVNERELIQGQLLIELVLSCRVFRALLDTLQYDANKREALRQLAFKAHDKGLASFDWESAIPIGDSTPQDRRLKDRFIRILKLTDALWHKNALPVAFKIAPPQDWGAAIFTGIRAAVVLSGISWLWLNSHNTYLTNVFMMCCVIFPMLTSMPSSRPMILSMVYGIAACCFVSFFITWGWMISHQTSLAGIAPVIIMVYLATYLIAAKTRLSPYMMPFALFWCFFIPINDTPIYNIESWLNGAVATIISMLIVYISMLVLAPSSSYHIARRRFFLICHHAKRTLKTDRKDNEPVNVLALTDLAPSLELQLVRNTYLISMINNLGQIILSNSNHQEEERQLLISFVSDIQSGFPDRDITVVKDFATVLNERIQQQGHDMANVGYWWELSVMLKLYIHYSEARLC